MVFQDERLKFSHLETVLSAAVLELQRNKEKLQAAVTKDDIAVIQVHLCHSIIYLWTCNTDKKLIV